MNLIGRILVIVALGGCGLYMGSLGVADWRAGVRSEGWSTVAGTVFESRVQYTPGHGKVGPTYKPRISYRYKVGGLVYEGDRFSFGRATFGSGCQDAESIVGQHPVGSSVRVHYDPTNPDDSVLQVGWTWSAVLRVAIGVLLVVLGFTVKGKRRSLTSA